MKRGVIIADPASRAWSFAKEVHSKILAKGKDFPLYPVEITKFADNETYVQVLENVREKKCYFIQDSSKTPNDWFMEILLVNDALKRASAHRVVDILPYLKYSRQDRKDKSRVPISAKVVADGIGAGSDHIITMDLHASQIQGFYGQKPFDNLHAFPTMAGYLQEKYPAFLENVVVVSPDAGGVSRTRSFAKRLNKDIAIIDKRREKAGEVAGMNIVGDVLGKNAIIVDDIVDSGNTLIEAGKALKAKGALQVYACCTHALLNKNAVERLPKSLDKIIVTDTIPHDNLGNIECVSLTGLYADAIYRTHHGKSLSELFV